MSITSRVGKRVGKRLSRPLTAAGVGGGGGFSPASLFAASEQGVWYDPSDLSTMFQDSTGTTPVTAVEQPVGLILDKSGRGNHATQPTAAARPKLSARKNRVVLSDDFSGNAWQKSYATVTGRTAVTFPAGTANLVGLNQFVLGIGSATTNVISATMSSATGAVVRLKLTQSGTADYYSPNITLTPTPTRYEFSATWGAGTGKASVGVVNSTTGAAAEFVLDKFQLESGTTATTYQRVNTATDYDSVGFPHYLVFDGVDDFLSTGNIDFTGTDKMTVVAGVQRSGTSIAALIELADLNTGNSFGVLAPSSANTMQAGLHGPAGAQYELHSYADSAAPSLGAWSFQFDRAGGAGAEIVMRKNGVAVGANTRSDNTTGNFDSAPLYIGRRNGTTLPFNGHLYQLVVRGALTIDLAPTETFTADKTGVTL